MNISEAQQIVCKAGKKLLDEGLVARTWGNVSLRFDGNKMAITPTGRPYETMMPYDIVIVDIRDMSHEGNLEPSSEGGLHAEVYKRRKEINAVIHTHQQNASTVAAAHREVPPILDDMAQIVGPSVRVAHYALPSTKKLIRQTIKALKGRNAALLANHGAICVGNDMDEAFMVCRVLEKACKSFIEAEFLGGAQPIHKLEAHIMRQYYLRKYSKKKYL